MRNEQPNSEQTLAAEKEYANLCATCSAIAITNAVPLPYRWLRPKISAPPDSRFEEMKQHGWTDEHVKQAKELIKTTNDIAVRLQGSLGRLISSPRFCSARDTLREQWRSLPDNERPPLPLLRSIRVAQPVEGLNDVPVSGKLADVAAEFDKFCDVWRATGMTTWDLPDIEGPKWPAPELRQDASPPGQLTIDTPWHFPLLAKDGLGNLPRQEHEQLAEELGIEDHKSWQTYGQMFLIDFWEKVIRSRYADRKRRRRFVTAMTSVVADIVGLDRERVQKLRKQLSSLRSGRTSSIVGKR